MTELLMLLMGLAAHFIKDMARIRKETGRLITPRDYWLMYPYQSLLCIIGAVAGYLIMYETGQLSGVNAFGIGYLANSIADIIGKRGVLK